MKASKIKISNILGIESLEINPGSITEITGGNGAGKSSVIEAIKTVLNGAHDATLLRNGSDEGEVVLVLDQNLEITKRIGKEKSTIEMRDGHGKLSGPVGRIKDLIDALSVNPVEFLIASEKDRLKLLLEAMPMEVNKDKMSVLLGVCEGRVFDLSGHACEVIEQARKAVFDERTTVNRIAKEKRAAASQFRDTIPTFDETLDAESLQAELSELDGKMDEAIIGIKTNAGALKSQIKDLNRKMSDLQHQLHNEESRVGNENQKIRASFDLRRGELNAKLREARQAEQLKAKADQTRDTIKSMISKAAEVDKESARLTVVIEELDAYKSELLSDLPIKGVEVKDGEIVVDGVLFDRLNTAKQITLSVELARLRARELGLVCVDGAERLDKKTYKEFCKQAAASGMQLIVTKVGEGAMSVTVNEEVPA